MESYIKIIFTISTFNILLLFFFDFLKKKINIFDFPDNEKKTHTEPISLMGGWILLLNLVIYIFLFSKHLSILEIKILLCTLSFLIVGIFDDKFNLSPNVKFLILTVTLISFFYFTPSMVLNSLNFYGIILNFNDILGIFISTLCVLLFVNAFNLFDGINLQSSIYALFLLLILFFKGMFTQITIVLILALFLIIYLNFKNKIFLGDSGSLLLGSIISLFVIANYNISKSIRVDEIFLLMMLPGLDMLRLFIERIYNSKNPFLGDREHLHHYLLSVYRYKLTIIFTVLLFIMPTILNIYLSSKIIIPVFVLIYLCLIYYLKKIRISTI